LEDPENPIELAFQEKYGTIVAYDWYGQVSQPKLGGAPMSVRSSLWRVLERR
jgi:hypothetical protein